MQSQTTQPCWNKLGSARVKARPQANWPVRYHSRFSEILVRHIEGAWDVPKEVVVAETQTDLEKTFHRLAEEWLNETWFISSIKKRISHPAHLKIIGLGRPVIPLIIKEMRNSSDHWFFALEAITREDPAPHAENMHQLAAAWLAWAKTRGY